MGRISPTHLGLCNAWNFCQFAVLTVYKNGENSIVHALTVSFLQFRRARVVWARAPFFFVTETIPNLLDVTSDHVNEEILICWGCTIKEGNGVCKVFVIKEADSPRVHCLSFKDEKEYCILCLKQYKDWFTDKSNYGPYCYKKFQTAYDIVSSGAALQRTPLASRTANW